MAATLKSKKNETNDVFDSFKLGYLSNLIKQLSEKWVKLLLTLMRIKRCTSFIWRANLFKRPLLIKIYGVYITQRNRFSLQNKGIYFINVSFEDYQEHLKSLWNVKVAILLNFSNFRTDIRIRCPILEEFSHMNQKAGQGSRQNRPVTSEQGLAPIQVLEVVVDFDGDLLMVQIEEELAQQYVESLDVQIFFGFFLS